MVELLDVGLWQELFVGRTTTWPAMLLHEGLHARRLRY